MPQHACLPRDMYPEESATGMAAGPLACYLYDYIKIKKSDLPIEQALRKDTALTQFIQVTA